ncbi:phospholipase [Litoribacillus peritrichatus]|uniref:Phospholipase C n=1 Tax=Litoribacillus peritrichatus TaxID=718191 RepID=A0ABP7MAI2_9GAMM
MKLSKSILALVPAVALLAPLTAEAYTKATHKQIAIDAVKYMQQHPETTEFNRLNEALLAAGYTVDSFAEIIGQGAFDVDDFEDTFICGAVTGDCVEAPVWGLGSSIVKYTSYWHFQNHTQGSDVHGNDLGGYNYDKLTVWGTVDNLAASWLYGDHLDDGRGGMRGWFGREDSEYNSYGITEANYRHDGYSSKSMYEDFEKAAFQPIDNLGQYWYEQFQNQPTAQTLGFVMHTTDLLQPHHTWTTSDLNHSGWESWVADYYDSEDLNNFNDVTAALESFTPLAPNATDIRPLLTEGGAISYAHGGLVLNSTEHSDRLQVAKVTIPHAIAMVVHILNNAAYKLNP